MSRSKNRSGSQRQTPSRTNSSTASKDTAINPTNHKSNLSTNTPNTIPPTPSSSKPPSLDQPVIGKSSTTDATIAPSSPQVSTVDTHTDHLEVSTAEPSTRSDDLQHLSTAEPSSTQSASTPTPSLPDTVTQEAPSTLPKQSSLDTSPAHPAASSAELSSDTPQHLGTTELPSAQSASTPTSSIQDTVTQEGSPLDASPTPKQTSLDTDPAHTEVNTAESSRDAPQHLVTAEPLSAQSTSTPTPSIQDPVTQEGSTSLSAPITPQQSSLDTPSAHPTASTTEPSSDAPQHPGTAEPPSDEHLGTAKPPSAQSVSTPTSSIQDTVTQEGAVIDAPSTSITPKQSLDTTPAHPEVNTAESSSDAPKHPDSAEPLSAESASTPTSSITQEGSVLPSTLVTPKQDLDTPPAHPEVNTAESSSDDPQHPGSTEPLSAESASTPTSSTQDTATQEGSILPSTSITPKQSSLDTPPAPPATSTVESSSDATPPLSIPESSSVSTTESSSTETSSTPAPSSLGAPPISTPPKESIRETSSTPNTESIHDTPQVHSTDSTIKPSSEANPPSADSINTPTPSSPGSPSVTSTQIGSAASTPKQSILDIPPITRTSEEPIQNTTSSVPESSTVDTATHKPSTSESSTIHTTPNFTTSKPSTHITAQAARSSTMNVLISPAPSSATTLRDSPVMPGASFKWPLTSGLNTPIKEEEEPDDLLFKKPQNIVDPAVTSAESDELTTTGSVENATTNEDDATSTADLDGVISPDMKAMADMLHNMKRTLRAMESTMTVLGRQTEKVATLTPIMKANGKLGRLREILDEQAQQQVVEITQLRSRLEDELKGAVKDKLRVEALELVRKTVAGKVKERVREQLNAKIPREVKHQVKSHRRQVLEIKTNIHNMTARSFNSSLRSTTDTLRPLLRPLPSAEQSPPAAVLDTPINSEHAPTPSDLFPKSLGDLQSLTVEQVKQLMSEYRLDTCADPAFSSSHSVASSSSPMSAKELKAARKFAQDGGREDNLNKFMAHIGVPFRMIPVPSSVSQSQAGQRLTSPLLLRMNV